MTVGPAWRDDEPAHGRIAAWASRQLPRSASSRQAASNAIRPRATMTFTAGSAVGLRHEMTVAGRVFPAASACWPAARSARPPRCTRLAVAARPPAWREVGMLANPALCIARHQKVAGSAGHVTGEHASGPIRAVRRRRERQHQHAGLGGRRIPGTGRPQYVVVAMGRLLLACNLLRSSLAGACSACRSRSLDGCRGGSSKGRVRTARRDVTWKQPPPMSPPARARDTSCARADRTRRGRTPARRRCASAPQTPPACSSGPSAGWPATDGDTGRW